jgi:surface protein
MSINCSFDIPNGYSSVDCSYYKNNSVMCYWKEDPLKSGYYEMHISAKGEIYTPKNATSMFDTFGYYELETLNLTGLNTKYTENMYSMFFRMGYKKLKNLDLGDKFDTSNVTTMWLMFANSGNSSTVYSIDFGDKFNTANVTSMSRMFDYSAKNTPVFELDLTTFVFDNVTAYADMFRGHGGTVWKIYVKNESDRTWIVDNGLASASSVIVKS